MSTLVMKFGGTSTGTAEALNRAASIVNTQNLKWDRIVVVVSAMAGVTDMLIECTERARSRDKGSFQIAIDELRSKLSAVVHEEFRSDQYQAELISLIDSRLAELTTICQRIRNRGYARPWELDEVAALGERINVHVFSAVLRKHAVLCQPLDAAELIVTDNCHQAASPVKAGTDANVQETLLPLFDKGVIPVVTGFIGATPNGVTTTLGRGGSDHTAAILAESLEADEIWIWTDVDGVMTADPGLIPGARLIPELSYNEVFQLAYSGAEVLHPKTILPAREGNIPLFVKNTFNPVCSGTRISHCSSAVNHTVSAVTGLSNISTITYNIQQDADVYKIKSRLLAALKNRGITIWAVFQTVHDRSVSFAISAGDVHRVIETIRDSSTNQLFDRSFPRPRVTGNLSLITIVGRDIYLSPQVLSKTSHTLEEAGVDIKQIGNSTSPDAIVFAVEDHYARNAIQQIHDRVILNGHSTTPQVEPVLRHQPAF
jgi:aspartate kinase